MRADPKESRPCVAVVAALRTAYMSLLNAADLEQELGTASMVSVRSRSMGDLESLYGQRGKTLYFGLRAIVNSSSSMYAFDS